MDIQNIILKDKKGQQLWECDTSDVLINTVNNRTEIKIQLPRSFAKYAYLDIHLPYPLANTKIHCNGFQTWTESKAYHSTEKIKGLRPILKRLWGFFNMHRYGNYEALHYSDSDLHSYHYILIEKGGQFHCLADIAEEKGFGIWCKPKSGDSLILRKEIPAHTNTVHIQLLSAQAKTKKEAFAPYTQAIKNKLPIQAPVAGWTSWYNYYNTITSNIIEDNLQAFVEHQIPIDIFQIDDGWQQSIGDWLPNEKFEAGMQSLASNIQNHNIQAGLWMAPFVCDRHSSIYKNHQDWIRKDEKGKLSVAGYSLYWGGQFFVLEWRKPVVQAYIRNALCTAWHDWNYDLLKLDFLYAVSLDVQEHTPGQEMHDAMQFLRACAKDKKILACGVPLSPAYSTADYCRVSADIALVWEDYRLSHFIRYRERVSTLNALRTSIARTILNNQVLGNDPDVFILRKANHKLRFQQQLTLFLLNQAIGNVQFCSDLIDDYDKGSFLWYKRQFPLRQKQLTQIQEGEDCGYLCNEWKGITHCIAYNLTSKSKTIDLPNGNWTYKGKKVGSSRTLKPYETIVLLKLASTLPRILHTTGHIFPMHELETIEIKDNSINISLSSNFLLASTEISIEVPSFLRTVIINGTPINLDEKQHSVQYLLKN